jgi:hypothetical protein
LLKGEINMGVIVSAILTVVIAAVVIRHWIS